MSIRDRRTKLIIISIIVGLIAGVFTLYREHQDIIRHNQNQDVIIDDMKVLLDNQKLILANQKVFMNNYSELNVNPLAGSP